MIYFLVTGIDYQYCNSSSVLTGASGLRKHA